MSVITVMKEIKAIHPEYVSLIKIGKFYNVYLRDAYILSYLFGYKLRDMEQNIKTCGFPETALNKVISTLENKKINYYLFLSYGCFFLIIVDIYFRFYFNGKTIDYIVDAIIMLAVFIFYYKLLKIKETTLNKYALEEKKTK